MSIQSVLGFDLETTGVSDHMTVLECAVSVVRPDFTEYDHQRWVLGWDPADLVWDSPEVEAQHKRTGLLDEVYSTKLECTSVDSALVSYISKHWPNPTSKPMLFGFSVHHDWYWMRTWFPRAHSMIHYRVIDVSSIREARKVFCAEHRGAHDISAAVREMREILC